MDFKIGNKCFSKNMEPFIIAEAGINHNGSLETACKMIDIAKECNVDCIKFQTFKAEEFCGDKQQTYTYTSQGKTVTESMYDMFKRVEFSVSDWFKIKQYCDEKDILFMSTPQNKSDLDMLIEIGIPAIKIGSDDFINLPLINYYKTKNIPIIMSCGMADYDEIKLVLKTIGYPDFPAALLLCTSQYPTPLKDINLNKLKTLRKEFPELILGFSDHTRGSLSAGVAVGMEAVIFEKHFTVSHDLEGPDHWFSSNPEELKEWVNTIRNAYVMLGNYQLRPTTEEIEMRNIARRKIVALRDIQKGEIFTEDNLILKRASHGIEGINYYNIIGKKALNNITAGLPIGSEDYCE